MRRNFEMTLTAIITVTSCLILFGVFMLLSANINQIGNQIRSQCQIQAYIDFDATSAVEQQVVAELSNKEKYPNIKKCTFVSKAQAMRDYKEYLGESASAFEGVDGEEFLRSSVKIDMNDITGSKELAAQLEKVPNIVKVSNRQDVVDRIISVTDTIRNGSFIAMLILLFVAVFIIANTIKLSVEARKDEIHIMKYVGATASFVRRPFVLEGILTGVIGGMISLCIVSVGYTYAIKALTTFADIFTLIAFGEIFPFMLGTTLVFGIIMGAVGSAIALSKHLKV